MPRERKAPERLAEEIPEPAKKRSKTAKGGKKAKKAKKDPNAPKRPMSAYMIFMKENRASIKAENPDATFGELGKLGGESWRALTTAEKKPYNDKNKKDKARYEKEMKAYKK